MKRFLTAVAIAAITAGTASLAFADDTLPNTNATPGMTSPTTPMPPSERLQNGDAGGGESLASQPNPQTGIGQGVIPPGAKGAAEGGSARAIDPTKPKVISPGGEGGGVQNPSLGTGNNGSAPTR
jgi:hypothetical protein